MQYLARRLVVALTFFALLTGVSHAADDADARKLPRLTYGGPFEMVDQSGRTVTDEDFKGRFMLLYFGYTHCPDVCPTGLAYMASAVRKLGPAGEQVQPVFVTVDAQRDTPEILADYVKAFHPRMIGLTGSKRAVGRMARAYKVHFFAGEIDGKYLVDHTANTYLVGPDGDYITEYAHGTLPAELADKVKGEIEKFEATDRG